MKTLDEITLTQWMSEAMRPDSKQTATTALDRVARHLFGERGASRIYHKARSLMKVKTRLYPRFTIKAGETKKVTFLPPKED